MLIVDGLEQIMIRIENEQNDIVDGNNKYRKVKKFKFQNQDKKADINQVPEKIHIGAGKKTCFFSFQLINVWEKIGIMKVKDIVRQELQIVKSQKQSPEYNFMFDHSIITS